MNVSLFDGTSWLVVQPSTFKGGSHMLVRLTVTGEAVPLMLGSLAECVTRIRRRAAASAVAVALAA